MICLIEIFLLNLDLHHHLHRGSHMLLMVIALKGLLETEEGLNDEVLLVVDEAFIVMACR